MHITRGIELPPDTDLCRQLRKPIRSEFVDRYNAGNYGQYDERTVFFDIFYHRDTQQLVAMGPPLLNLAAVLLPMQWWVNGRPCRMSKKVDYKKLVVWSGKVDNMTYPAQIRLQFNNALRYDFPLEEPCRYAPRGRTLFTVQKNNKAQWIRDWIRYYRQAWHVDYVCIYDNHSDNQAELIDTLNSDTVMVMPWNYPWGVYRMPGNSFCQIGALNHFKYRFGRQCKIFNFDIDELLVGKDPQLQQRIDREAVLRFDSYNVPYDARAPEGFSFADFTRRNKVPRQGAYKYIIDGQTEDILTAHKPSGKNWLHTTWRKARRKAYRDGQIEPLDQAYFLHYLGITTSWKGGTARTDDINDKPASDYVTDNSVQQVFNTLAPRQQTPPPD